MVFQLGLPQEVLLEKLTEGLPASDLRLNRVAAPKFAETTLHHRGNKTTPSRTCRDHSTAHLNAAELLQHYPHLAAIYGGPHRNADCPHKKGHLSARAMHIGTSTRSDQRQTRLKPSQESRPAQAAESQVFWIVFDFYLFKKMDQRTCIKFCVKNEIKCADAFRMLTVAYGEATLDRSNVYRWYKMFSEGREDVNDEERAGRPSTSTTDEKINEVVKMILANRRITVREVDEDLNISIGSCHSIFINDLGMRRVAA
ncbi:hypothetical protein LAZ67_5002570 [Cordylochernes scorpioides]|uniref:Mos1 transposase HTH domain-containing protein n=1 Tax=Cordylochernes scorpioides TaxID=51811 RepID=A0ABY6KGH5_9ARAC|nr:hypothetical protein LAZ67_5002570 [Cordylochernes scorpioides]